MTIETHSARETEELGERIGSQLQAGDVLALRGTLAAGKTTLTKGIARALGVSEVVTSPTFTLISEYAGRIPVYHVDVYRLNDDTIAEEFYDLGMEELLYGQGVCIIEWSEKVADELPATSIIVSLAITGDATRRIDIDGWPYGAI